MLSKEELRDRVVRIIAATRFPFINQTDWGEDYVTITNDGGKRIRGVMGPDGPVYPGIVITRANTDIQEVVRSRPRAPSRRPESRSGG